MADAEGGFDCEFVEKPPKAVQSECPVCLLVLREPYQATCCGYGFCRVCIERVRAENKPCPCCNAEKFDSFEDKGRKRLLNEYQVHCTNKKLDCQWVGELGELENHLNSNPPLDKQLEGCQLTQVQCLHCFQPIQRSDIGVHQNDQCLKRPFACEYCKDHDSTYEDVTTKHWPVCGSYPVQCPNECSDETMERQSLNSHIANDCPLAVVDCDFKGVGCEVRLPRKDLATHLSDGLVAHVSLQTKQLMSLKEENKQLKMLQVAKQLVDLKEENGQLKSQVATLTKELWEYRTGTLLCPVELTMENFEQHKNDCDEWYSPPFYTHPKGYKMCLLVFAGGHSGGKDTHISVYIKLMKGVYDDQLKWPFRGKFTIQPLSQNGDEKHLTNVVFDDTVSKSASSQVVDRERSMHGRGRSRFIPHAQLKLYLQNDCLNFYVNKVD